MAAGGDQNYHRRLDRSFDDLSKLPDQDQALVYKLRSAIDGARSKFSKLRDSVDEKDELLSKETALRRAAEQKLEAQLVNMYPDQSVNDELHERLPRARRKSSPTKSPVIDEWVKEEETKAQRNSKENDSGTETDPPGKPHGRSKTKKRPKSGKDSSRHSKKHHRRSWSGTETPSEDEHHSARHMHMSQTFPGFSSMPQGGYGGPVLPPMGYYPPFPYAPPPPVIYAPSPHMQPPYSSVFSPPAAQSTPGRHEGQIASEHQGQGHPQGEAQTQKSGQSQRQPQDVGHDATLSVPVSGGSPPVAGNLGVRRHSDPHAEGNAKKRSPHKNHTVIGLPHDVTVGQDSPVAGDGSYISVPVDDKSRYLDQSRQVSLLLSELDAAKDLNKKLSDKLSETEKELESIKIAMKAKATESEADLGARATALVEELYRAQKERDASVMMRLRLANEERDEAIERWKQMNQSLASVDSGTEQSDEEDVDVPSLLSKLNQAESPIQIGKHGHLIKDKISGTKARRKEITMEEMKAILEERDALLAKCKKLEQELIKLQRNGSKYSPQHEKEQAIKAKLLATQQERDMALAKARKMEEEMQNIRVYYSLHKSLSQEANMRDQFNNTLGNIEVQLKQKEAVYEKVQKDSNQLLARLKGVQMEKEQAMAELNKSRMAQKEAEENAEKMERLVNVLRRKISGLGMKPDD
ncbi:uncharacterized protein LOC106156015 [Lingula anatina]|uniref:Uncharacterized protein LOC106156015 n=1 Tax=Lingula anatina TaxID=7574 RepID=A0A1S3HK94_LINAN|nr:uncharacterized protein LOC106156015 [Lingula anatina]|eukprot:XP_013386535.1 uncharacterized protein LOC106156015 [Lingula anatina]